MSKRIAEAFLHKLIEDRVLSCLWQDGDGDWHVEVGYDCPVELTPAEAAYLRPLIDERERIEEEERRLRYEEQQRMVPINKARAAVEHLARQLAAAMDAADRLAVKAQEAHAEAAMVSEQAAAAALAVNTAAAELEAAEAALLECQTELAQSNGQASGSANNPMIRIEENPPPE